MAKRYDSTDHSTEALQAREAQRQEYIRNGQQAPTALLAQLSADADALLARVIAKHGRD